MVMMKRDFLNQNSNVSINAKIGNIVDLPFDFNALR